MFYNLYQEQAGNRTLNTLCLPGGPERRGRVSWACAHVSLWRHRRAQEPESHSRQRGEVRGSSLGGDELGASGGTDTDLTVTNGLVGHGVLGQVVANHVGPDLDRVPVLARVHLSDGADHFGHDDAVTEVGLDRLGLLSVGSVLDGLGQLLDQAVVAGADAAAESSALARAEHGDHVVGRDLEQLVELNTSVNLLFEWFSLGRLGGLSSRKFFLDRGHI